MVDDIEADPSALLRAGAEQVFDSLDERRAFAAVSETLLGCPEDPATLDRFQIERRVGSGGMGVVYAAFDPNLGRRVALKLLKPERSSAKDEERLVDEAKALARLNHPNIVGVHEIGTVGERVFIAMELVEGVPLSIWLQTPRTWQEVARIAIEAGRGLVAAHETGLVHRDFKPANIMLRDDGHVVVLDFGLARVQDSFASLESTGHDPPDVIRGATQASTIAGTPAYMAPEQHLGRVATALSDQFSFCVSMYEAAYGERPFDAKTRHGLQEAIDGGMYRPTPKSRNVPSWFRRILQRGLQPAPGDRWPSMEALLAALERKLSPTWRRVAVPVAVAGAAVAVTLAVSVDEPTSCTDEASAISETWNDEVAQQIRGALQSIDHPSAARAPDLIESQLDTYAAAWHHRWEIACTARREVPSMDTQAQQVMACLNGQRQWLASSLELLSSPTGPLVADATRLVPDATHLLACDDPTADPKEARRGVQGEDVLLLRTEVEYKLNEASTEARMGRLDRAERLVERAREAANAADDDGLRSRVSLADGRQLEQRGDHVAARAAFELALVESERAHDTVARLAAMRRLSRHLIETGDLQEAARVLLRVEAAHQRFESRPWTWDADTLELRSLLAAQSKQHDDAVALARKRLEFIKRHAPEDRDRILRARLFVVQARLAIRDDESLDAEISEVLEEATSFYGQVHETTAVAYSQRGNQAYAAGRIDAALRWFEKSLAIREELETSETGLFKILNNVAVARARTGGMKSAEPTFERLAKIARENRPTYDKRLIKTLSNLAGVRKERAEFDAAVEMLREAVEISKSLYGAADPASVSAMYELSIGLVLNREREAAEAVLKHARELEIRERGEHTELGAQLLGGLANVAYIRGDSDAMLPLATKAYETLGLDAAPQVRAELGTLLVFARLSHPGMDATRADEILRELEALGDKRLRPKVLIVMSKQRATIDALLSK